MKTFEEYVDGQQVYYKDVIYSAYKSKYTHNAFRLKRGKEEVIADITEITPVEVVNEKSNRDLQPGLGSTRTKKDEDDIDTFFGHFVQD